MKFFYKLENGHLVFFANFLQSHANVLVARQELYFNLNLHIWDSFAKSEKFSTSKKEGHYWTSFLPNLYYCANGSIIQHLDVICG